MQSANGAVNRAGGGEAPGLSATRGRKARARYLCWAASMRSIHPASPSAAYDPAAIEARWQAFWERERTFATPNPGQPGFDPSRPKFYVLDMFPYPSGAGLHVGHPMGYIGSDVIARRLRMQGHNVLHPMGYDAFGLPAEQYAIQHGKHPAQTTAENIATFRRQLRSIGLSYDWEREIDTSDPGYYRWTQWIFARLFDRGLAYQAEVPVWWCEELKTVLANEEVINGRSERGDYPCVRRPLRQWMLRITAYADRLLDDLELVDWPESIKAMQREWIGRSSGAEIRFPLEGGAGGPGDGLVVFTTRPDTLWGATFMVIAPEHALVRRLTRPERRAEVEAYCRQAALKSDLERTELAKSKTGVFTGSYALHPLLDPADERAHLPVYVADYVLASYGTGAIMSVPGHDERDFEFAQLHGLPVREVVRPPAGTPGLEQGASFTGDGVAVNSGPLDGLPTERAKARALELLAERGAGSPKTTYRLRDWLFSRQRYWGEPFPLLHHADGRITRVPDAQLPVVLPQMTDFKPTSDGLAPLARASDWVNAVDPATGERARRETDSMPGWAGSCWYYLRFMDPHNDRQPFAPEAERYWGPVDLYIGGTEHAVLHLLYARFWHKVLFDLGVVSTPEPFQRLFNQGMLTAYAFKDASGRLVPADEVEERDGRAVLRESGAPVESVIAKMSKSLKNVVNPDEVCAQYGVDTFRLYEMFMGPLSDSKPWNPRDIPGCRRFLERVWRLFVDEQGTGSIRPHLRVDQQSAERSAPTAELERHFNRALARVDDSFKGFNFNTAIAALMTFVNEATGRMEALDRSLAERFVLALAPFAPHVSEELWSRLGNSGSIAFAPWPAVIPEFLVEDEIEIAVQVQGKLRGKARVSVASSEPELLVAARAAAQSWLEGKTVVKTVVVPGKLVNFVVR
jgi:leucyl-tRNA synthetase